MQKTAIYRHVMDTQFSDSELLDLSMNFSEKDNEEHSSNNPPLHKDPPLQETEQEDQPTTPPKTSTQELQHKTQEIVRHKVDNNRHTLRKLNHKLDKIHDQLAQAKQRLQLVDPRLAYRPLLRRNYPSKLPATYELAATPARVTFRITNPYYIQWQPN